MKQKTKKTIRDIILIALIVFFVFGGALSALLTF